MASYKAFVISGFLLVTITIVVQSVPIGKPNHIVQSSLVNNKQAVRHHPFKFIHSGKSLSSSVSTTSTGSQNPLPTPQITQEKKDNKKKRYIDDDQLDELFDSENDEVDSKPDNIDHTLHAKVQETSAKIHDNADKPIDTDDSKVFSDIKMTPNELTDVRRRRDIKLNEETNRRRKRALSPYDFYDTDSFYNPYADIIERHRYVRPIRSFAPIYWYPSSYERTIRSVLKPSFYESSEWPSSYSSTSDDDDESDENPVSIYDDDNDYESNRYPILLQSSNNPFDNLQLQQQYNTDDLPIDEDFEENFNDDDNDDEEPYHVFYPRERSYYNRYEPIDTYF
jgi:hypothetical protein